MKRRKPKTRPKRKAKRKPEQHTSMAVEPVPTHIAREQPASAIETQDPAIIAGTQVELENSVDTVELRDEAYDPASTVEIRGEHQYLESIIEIQVEIENSASPEEIRDATTAPTDPVEIEIPVIPGATPAVLEEPAPHSVPPTVADRRAHPRYAFAADIQVVTADGSAIKTQVRDISQQGCYVDTGIPLPLGTPAEVRITKGATAFQARARVVYNQTDKGMGLMFIAVEPEQFSTLNAWINESRESSWRAANRRRSQRVLMKVPVRVSGKAVDGASFEEDTHTLSISPHGALIMLSAPVYRGQRFTLSNIRTKAALECVVAHLERIPGEPTQVGVEFMLPHLAFWRVAFPPKDWTPRHPDAKSR